jgi:lysophospholipase L1-like esterase
MDHGETSVKQDKYSILLEEDSNGIIHNVPNARYEKWEINSFGFRGREINLEKREDQIRIVCLGASESFGLYESKNKEWPSQLGEMLKDPFPRVEVINASVIGLNFDKRKDYVEKYVLPLKPDILILLNQRFVLFVKDTIRGLERREGVNQGKGRGAENPIKVLLSRGKSLSKLDQAIGRCLPTSLSTAIRMWRLREKIRRKEKRHCINQTPMDEVPENIVLEYEKDLRLFIRYLDENHILPVLSTYPALITPFNKDIHKNLLLATRHVYCIELSEIGLLDASKKLNDVVRRVAEEYRLPFVDNDRLIPKTLEYFGDNFHYTNKGAEFIAKNFYDLLNQGQLIK